MGNEAKREPEVIWVLRPLPR